MKKYNNITKVKGRPLRAKHIVEQDAEREHFKNLAETKGAEYLTFTK